METLALEHQRHAALSRAQNKASRTQDAPQKVKSDTNISSLEGGMMASFIFFAFDVPNAIFAWFVFTYPLSLLWGAFGWLTVLFWLWLKGYGIFKFDTKHNLLMVFLTSYGATLLGLPGLSGFIVSLIIKERMRGIVPVPLNAWK